MIKMVCFDLDDTLAAEDNFIRSGYRHVAEVIYDEHYEAVSGYFRENGYGLRDSVCVDTLADILYGLYLDDSKLVFNRFLKLIGIEYDNDTVLGLVREYREHKPNTFFYEDVIPTLSELKKDGYLLSVVSDGFLVSQKNKADVLSLNEYFDRVIFTDEYGEEYRKPSGRAFMLLASEYSLKCEEIVYVGDNPKKDFAIKKNVPVKCMRIMRPGSVYENAEYTKEITEDIRLYSLTEIPEKLKRIDG